MGTQFEQTALQAALYAAWAQTQSQSQQYAAQQEAIRTYVSTGSCGHTHTSGYPPMAAMAGGTGMAAAMDGEKLWTGTGKDSLQAAIDRDREKYAQPQDPLQAAIDREIAILKGGK